MGFVILPSGLAAQFRMALAEAQVAIVRNQGHFQSAKKCGMRLRRCGIEENIERRNLALANDDHVQARVVRRLAARAGAPS